MQSSARQTLHPMLSQGRAAFDFVGTTEAEATEVDTAARRDELVKIYPSPMATADVVLVLTPGDRGDRLREIVSDRAGDELRTRVEGAERPRAPPDDGLPSPGLLDALAGRAREVTGR